MARKEAPMPSNGQGRQPFPEWERLTQEEQAALIETLTEAAQEIRDQVDAELGRLERSSAAGRMLARVDSAGLARQPIPPLPDLKRDAPYEKLALDLYRLATIQ